MAGAMRLRRRCELGLLSFDQIEMRWAKDEALQKELCWHGGRREREEETRGSEEGLNRRTPKLRINWVPTRIVFPIQAKFRLTDSLSRVQNG